MTKYRYSNLNIRMSLAMKDMLQSKIFINHFGRSNQLFIQALHQLQANDQTMIQTYLKSANVLMPINHDDQTDTAFYTFNIARDLKTKLDQTFQKQPALKLQIKTVSNYLRHVANFYLNQIVPETIPQNYLKTNPIRIGDLACYQVAATYDPKRQYYRVFLPGFNNYQVIVMYAAQIPNIIQHFRTQMIDQIKHQTIPIVQPITAEPLNRHTTQTTEFIINLKKINHHIQPSDATTLTLDVDHQTLKAIHRSGIDPSQVLHQYYQSKKH